MKNKFVMHNYWGLCKIIKRTDKHGYVVQSSKRGEGDYLNVYDRDFVQDGVNDCVNAFSSINSIK